MGEASQAFDDNQLDVAQAKFQAALVMNPRSPEALNGLAGLYVKGSNTPLPGRLSAVGQDSARQRGRLARAVSLLCARRSE